MGRYSGQDLEQNKLFLEEVRNFPCLWDKRSYTYRNTSAKNKAWNEISSKFGLDDYTKARQKFNNLKGTYFSKKNSRITTGSAASSANRQKWDLYDIMHSLCDNNDQNEVSLTNMEDSDEQIPEPSTFVDQSEFIVEYLDSEQINNAAYELEMSLRELPEPDDDMILDESDLDSDDCNTLSQKRLERLTSYQNQSVMDKNVPDYHMSSNDIVQQQKRINQNAVNKNAPTSRLMSFSDAVQPQTRINQNYSVNQIRSGHRDFTKNFVEIPKNKRRYQESAYEEEQNALTLLIKKQLNENTQNTTPNNLVLFGKYITETLKEIPEPSCSDLRIKIMQLCADYMQK